MSFHFTGTDMVRRSNYGTEGIQGLAQSYMILNQILQILLRYFVPLGKIEPSFENVDVEIVSVLFSSLLIRKDLRDLFEQLAISYRSMAVNTIKLNGVKPKTDQPKKPHKLGKRNCLFRILYSSLSKTKRASRKYLCSS